MTTIMTLEFQAELDQMAKAAARKAVTEITERWVKQHAEQIVFEACRSYARVFLAEKQEQIRAGFQHWMDTRLEEAVAAAAKQTLDQIVGDVRARMLGRK